MTMTHVTKPKTAPQRPSVDAPERAPKSALKGMTFDEGAKALSPDAGAKDQKPPSKGVLASIKGALGLGKKGPGKNEWPEGHGPRGADPQYAKHAQELVGIGMSMCAQGDNISKRLALTCGELKNAPEHAELRKRAGSAIALVKNVQSKHKDLVKAADQYLVDGMKGLFMGAAQAFLTEASYLRLRLMGTAEGDSYGPLGIMLTKNKKVDQDGVHLGEGDKAKGKTAHGELVDPDLNGQLPFFGVCVSADAVREYVRGFCTYHDAFTLTFNARRG